MKIFTSYYKRVSDKSEGLIPIRISTTMPDWFKACSGELPQLYPGMEMVNDYKSGRLSDEGYIVKYKTKLAALNPDDIIKKLEDISKVFGDRDVVLLCYEPPAKLCHRHLVAEWLSENTEYEVTELQ